MKRSWPARLAALVVMLLGVGVAAHGARAQGGGSAAATDSVAASRVPARDANRPKDSCLDCHRTLEDKRLSTPTRDFAQDIHAVRGLGCVGCHGGNPADPEMTAMDPDKGFKGAPARKDIAERCASCHADAAYMKRYNPQPYIFSMAEFRTSVHCKKIAEGDQKVATCTNCHGVHGILPHKDPRSPVYKQNVPFTCAKCHNAEYMKGRTVPTNQLALYRTSVHGVALLEKGDLSAPACNNCHGNHGAVPPKTRDISVVCGNCHGREGELFAGSKVAVTLEFEGKRGCVTCHSNHGIQRPTDAMIGLDGDGLCGRCHAPDSPGARAAAVIVPRFHAFKTDLGRADSLLAVADRLGMEISSGRDLLKQANDELVGLRAVIHSFSLPPIEASLAEGEGLAGRAEAQAREALRDWRNRRLGMAASLVAILVLIGLLAARIRQVERRSA
jgi:predicted CXXCH cytochrome family protein